MFKLLLMLCLALPVLLQGFSRNPPPRRSGVPTDDGGIVCTACHRTFVTPNPDTLGSVTVESADEYVPGVAQTIKVTVKHPNAVRWGFQLTARLVNNTNDQAGSFSGASDTITRCDGAAGSCDGGARQFIGHANAPVTAEGVGNTFEFQWTPPANESGDIMLYFAGNAADNSSNNTGDRIYTGTKRLRLAPGNGCSNPRPTFGKLMSDASGIEALSPNMLLTLSGSNLQSPGVSRSGLIGNTMNGFYPKEFSCVAVEINGQRTAILAASPDQMTIQAPWIVDTGMHQVTVIANPGRPNEVRSDIGTVMSSLIAPAFYTVEGKFVLAALANGTVIGDPAVTTNARPARPGEVVLISATGFGLTDPVWQNGEVVLSEARVPLPFTVTLGETTLDSGDDQYLGLTVGSISGRQQLRIRIPDSTPDGTLPLKVTINGVSTPEAGAVLLVQR
jgi:uncharacterized protein (TIGR03437 family)